MHPQQISLRFPPIFEFYKKHRAAYVQVVTFLTLLPLGFWSGFQLGVWIRTRDLDDTGQTSFLLINIIFCFASFFASFITLIRPNRAARGEKYILKNESLDKWTFPVWVMTTFVSIIALWINLQLGGAEEETYGKLILPYIIATSFYGITMTLPLIEISCCIACLLWTCFSGGDNHMYKRLVNKPFDEEVKEHNTQDCEANSPLNLPT